MEKVKLSEKLALKPSAPLTYQTKKTLKKVSVNTNEFSVKRIIKLAKVCATTISVSAHFKTHHNHVLADLILYISPFSKEVLEKSTNFVALNFNLMYPIEIDYKEKHQSESIFAALTSHSIESVKKTTSMNLIRKIKGT